MPVNRTDNANAAPRCQHAKLNGEPCRAPAVRGRTLCHLHEEIEHPRPGHALVFVEDAATLLLAIRQVIRALVDDTIDTKKAALILYGLQIASSNLKRFAQEQPQAESEKGEEEEGESLAALLLRKLEIETEEQAAERRAREAAEDALNPLGQAG